MQFEEGVYEMIGQLTEDCQYVYLEHWKMFRRLLTKWVGKDVIITIKELQYKRSEAQNRLIHGLITPYVMRWYYETHGERKTHDEIYTWLRIAILEQRPRITEVAGEQVVTMTGKRFSKMTKKEFAEAVDLIMQRMAERGCYIPEPHKHDKANHFPHEYLKDE
jgi:hypothetical protein